MTEKKPDPARPLHGDDRNLVGVDAGDAGLSLEDRLFLTWRNHRGLIIAGAVLIVGLIVGRGAWGAYVEAREERIRAAFGTAETTEEKRAFARDNSGHALAGVALLQAADDLYQSGDFRMAAVEYSAATQTLEDSRLRARARLGEALSAIQTGSTADGEPLLRGIIGDASVPEPIQAEARYHLASLQFAEGQFEEARTSLDELSESPAAGAWAGPIGMLRAQLPPRSPDAPDGAGEG